LNTYIFKILIRFMIPYVWLKVRLIRIINFNISKLIEMKSYRGKRQFDNLPCRGQRTRTNAASRKAVKFVSFAKNFRKN
jgi:ribosomal protein S13